MKTLGIVRKLDQLGRITLPKELRRTLGIEERDEIEIYTENSTICLRAVKTKCVCCGSEDKLLERSQIHICSDCLEKFE